MDNAVSAVRTGEMGIKKASGVFCVPKTTLRRRARDKNKLAKDGTKDLGGKRPVFTEAMEQDLVNHVNRYGSDALLHQLIHAVAMIAIDMEIDEITGCVSFGESMEVTADTDSPILFPTAGSLTESAVGVSAFQGHSSGFVTSAES